jgi:5-methylcytosine-specific restriction protein B
MMGLGAAGTIARSLCRRVARVIGIIMRASRRQPLPLAPLLGAYTDAGPVTAEELGRVPGLGARFEAIRKARGSFLSEKFLDTASDAEFTAALRTFYTACVQPALHAETIGRRSGILRHALGHLLRCREPLPRRLEGCLAVDGPYHVGGLGPAFWSALVQALDPNGHPGWLPLTRAGSHRLGLTTGQPNDAPAVTYAALLQNYVRVRGLAASLSAQHIDHFLSLVALMRGRNLWSGADHLAGMDLPALIREERTRTPLRRRLKERGRQLDTARAQLEAALQAQDGPGIGAALALADPLGARSCRLDWRRHGQALTLWVGRLWEAEDPDEILRHVWEAEPIPRAGLWLPAAVLHLKAPDRYAPWPETSRRGYAVLDDSADHTGPTWERYRLFNEGMTWLRAQHRLHPLEAPAVLAALDAQGPGESHAHHGESRFDGFCADTFRFLDDLSRNNRRDWMAGQRERYHFAVRAPLVELCRALAERYVAPVLGGAHGWQLETDPRSGRAITSICKNDYGRSVPYNEALWLTFYRREFGGKRDDAQFFVRLDATGLCYGLQLGRYAREAGRLLRHNIQEHAELLHRALVESGAFPNCNFGGAPPSSPADLRAWAANKSLVAAKVLPRDAPLLETDALVGDILLTFDRLLPAYACAVAADPVPLLEQRAGVVQVGLQFTDADFQRHTFLGDDWLRRARSLLDLKRQLILQGVPGTGKTHVARCLARLLTRGRKEAVRLVQFHPAYSYEEFVEGIKVKSVEVEGRHDVTYPVEEGLLCAFAAEAARAPSEPFVLIIDEINRGNLPRVFGELLYLLEYREQAVGLPYSRRDFRLPANLYLLGTMNAGDRSVALVDQALRRRFSFLEMPPDAGILAAWLRQHPPPEGPAFAAVVLRFFERLNDRLRADLGTQQQVGHSYFMVPDLDEPRLRVIWEHQVKPLVAEHCLSQPQRLAAYELDALLQDNPAPRTERRRRAADIAG